MTFGQKIQAFRKERGLSQDALASQLYVTRQSVSQWENDKSMPSVDLLVKLSQIFDTTVDALLGKAESEKEPKPIASAEVLKDKKRIKRALGSEFRAVIYAFFGAAIFFAYTSVLYFAIYGSAFSEKLLKTHSITGEIYYFLYIALLCAFVALIFFIVRMIITKKAVRYAQKNDSELLFYPDKLVIQEFGKEPISLFYTNIKRIKETDYYYILTMLNGVKLCMDKREIHGSSDELAKLLRSSKTYIKKKLSQSMTPPSERALSVICAVRDILFVATFACFWAIRLIFALLWVNGSLSTPVEWVIFLAPFIILLAETVLGIVLTIKRIYAKRLIIAGGMLLAGVCLVTWVTHVLPLYTFNLSRVTPEEFTASMQAHGLTVENTIYGREENFITECLTAKPADGTYEIVYMNFNDTAGDYGLHAAYECYHNHLVKINSVPRSTTKNIYLDLGYNAFYTEITNQKYAYVSNREYTVIYTLTSAEKAEEVQASLSDFKMKLPY